MDFFIFMQNELDEVVRTWNTHQIRPRPGQGMPGVRPVLIFSMPEIHGTGEVKLKSVVSEEVAVCNEENTPKGQYPCDKIVFELCALLMEEKGLTAPVDPCHAAELYTLLINEILENT